MTSTARFTNRSRHAVLALLALSTMAMVAGWIGVRLLTQDPRAHFAARYQPIEHVQEWPESSEDDFLLQDVRITTVGDLAVDVTIKRPAADTLHERRRPVVILLGGHRTGRDAARLIEDTHGTAVVALSYPFTGDHEVTGLAVVKEATRARAAILDTPPAVRVIIDWLEAQPWADESRVEAVGVSFGAAFAVIAGALDDRINRVWSIHGAGDPYLLLRTNLAPYVPTGLLQSITARLANVAMNGPQLAPELWAGELTPRPLIMVNAANDLRMPREAVLTLFESADEPRELLWLEGGHVSSRSRDLIRTLVDTVFSRMIPDGEVFPVIDGDGEDV